MEHLMADLSRRQGPQRLGAAPGWPVPEWQRQPETIRPAGSQTPPDVGIRTCTSPRSQGHGSVSHAGSERSLQPGESSEPAPSVCPSICCWASRALFPKDRPWGLQDPRSWDTVQLRAELGQPCALTRDTSRICSPLSDM